MSRADATLAEKLAEQAAAGRSRRRRTVEAREPGGVRVTVEGRECVSFCSNDYLGLADHPRIVAAFCDAARRWGVGSGASHLVSGHDARTSRARGRTRASSSARPRALLFSTGYMANLAVASVLVGRGDHVLEDRLNHASLLDAGLASGARFARFAHGDVAALRTKLSGSAPTARTLVMTDGVFSMDGDIAPLRDVAAACRESAAQLLVDDAHGFGVLGATGAGAVEEAGLGLDDVPILMCTLGKAVGTFGAFVAGSAVLIESLLQRARTYIYTTALPPAVAAATRESLRVMRDEPWRRSRVLEHAHVSARASRTWACNRCRRARRFSRCWSAMKRPPSLRATPCSNRASGCRRFVRRPCLRARRACASRSRPRTLRRRSISCWHALQALRRSGVLTPRAAT